MLRISFSDSAEGQHWVLCGRLAGPWVNELRACWQYARDHASRSQAVIDMREVTFVDADGEQLLAEMRGADAEFVASGVEMKHLLENLNSNNGRKH
jgi:anti-anti-sigma regulatory factor